MIIECDKFKSHQVLIEDFFKSDQIAIIEFGRMRNTSEAHKFGDGWSTYTYARSEKVKVLYSVDNNPETIQVCKEAIPVKDLNKIKFLSDYTEYSRRNELDLIFIDGPNESKINLDFLDYIMPLAKDDAIISVDDYSIGNKHKEIEPILKDLGYKFDIVGDMIVFSK